jgi:DNA topoisomerase-1
VVKALGPHPETKEPIEVLEGPYGLYVKCGTVNATVLPKEKTAEELTLADALTLIADKIAAGGGGKAKKPKGAKVATKKPKAPKLAKVPLAPGAATSVKPKHVIRAKNKGKKRPSTATR